MIKFIFFALPLVLMVFSIARKLFWTEDTTRREFEGILKFGTRKHVLRSSWPSVLIAVCFFGSRPYVFFPTFWSILGGLSLVIPAIFFVFSSADEFVQEYRHPSEETIQNGIKKKKHQGMLSIALLVVWIYAWHPHFLSAASE